MMFHNHKAYPLGVIMIILLMAGLIFHPEDPAAQQKIDLNTAPAEVLETLPGIGPVRAQSIIEFRKEHGAFTSIEQIKEVPGIGEGIFEQIKDLISVGEEDIDE